MELTEFIDAVTFFPSPRMSFRAILKMFPEADEGELSRIGAVNIEPIFPEFGAKRLYCVTVPSLDVMEKLKRVAIVEKEKVFAFEDILNVYHPSSTSGNPATANKAAVGSETAVESEPCEPKFFVYLAHTKEHNYGQEEFYQRLRRQLWEATIFYDLRGLKPKSEIPENVRLSKAVIVLLSSQFFFRPWCLIELFTAKRHGIPIIPVVVEEYRARFDRDHVCSVFQSSEYPNKFAHEEVALLKEYGIELADLPKMIMHVLDNLTPAKFSFNDRAYVKTGQIRHIVERIHSCEQPRE